MNFSPRRIAAAVIATGMIVSLGMEPALAQMTPGGATVGPAGGVPSTTAPANGQGTPAGGTGVISTTRVGPSGVSPMAAPATTPMADPMAAPARPRRVRHRRVRRARPAAEVGTQSQQGTNGSVAPSSK